LPDNVAPDNATAALRLEEREAMREYGELVAAWATTEICRAVTAPISRTRRGQ
jgi:hypothetical protein